ncbi:NADH-quinone oxidoreductase subunit M [Bosea thiooxidans]
MYHAIVFLPLIGFLIAGLLGRLIGARGSEIVTTSLLFVSAVLSWIALAQVGFGSGTTRIQVANWISSGQLQADWAFRIDTLTAVMLVVVNTVSSLVHLYSIGYMHEDPHRPRFFAYLSLFTFAMLMLVTADNLVQMFFGWEGVGLASYLLIGFWYQKPSANAAAIKAFVVNRVGDFGFLLGIFLIFVLFGAVTCKRRVYASYKFFLYTLLGSVLMLLAVMAMYWNAGTTDIPTLLAHKFPSGMQKWLWIAFFASFAVKMPMWPVHTWLPDAHVEAPTAGSVILAAILLKMGGYGFIRFSIPMFPEASAYFAPLVFALSVIAIVYTSLVALMQEDIKKLIAYSSVAHMGFVTMGLFTLTPQGIQGAMFQMMSHGLVSGALFLCVGVIYDRMHTREIAAYGGLVNRMPLYAVVFMVFTMANVGLPGTAGFVGEFLTLLGAFRANPWVAFLATSGVILSAGYALWLYRRVVFGELVKPELKDIKDLNGREIAILVPLVLLTIWYGVQPHTILDAFAAPTEALIKNYQAALAVAKTAVAAAQ